MGLMGGYYRGRGIFRILIVGGLVYGAIVGAARLMSSTDNEFVLFGIMVGAALLLGALVFKLWN